MDYPKLLVKYYGDKCWSCGDTYDSLQWYDNTIDKPTKEELELKYEDLIVVEMREKRNRLLKETDFRALPDYPNRDKWLIYRQQLRDLPENWSIGDEFPMQPN